MTTLMDTVARFCDLRDLLELARTSARWRGVCEIAQVLGVARDAAEGGEAIEELVRINEASWNIGPVFVFAPMREIEPMHLTTRTIALFATRYDGKFAHIAEQIAQHPESRDTGTNASIRKFTRALRGEDGPEEESKHGTRRIWLAAIFMNCAVPAHYEMIDKYVARNRNEEPIIALIAQLILMNGELSQFVECIVAEDIEGARAQMPQLRDATLRFICDNWDIITLEMVRYEFAPKFIMGPKFAHSILYYEWSALAYEQFDVDSPIFGERIWWLRERIAREKSGPFAAHVTAREISLSIIHAAKNPDPRAFELVYDMVRELREFCGICEVMQGDEDLEVIQRAVVRLESKGMIVSFGEYITNSFRHQRIPRFATATSMVDLILSRSARSIAEGKYPFQAEAVRFFAQLSYVFGSRVMRVIEQHFADYPSILARIRGYSRDSMLGIA